MKWNCVAICAAAFWLASISPAWSQGKELGLRAGISDARSDQDFREFELFGTLGLPWGAGQDGDWRLGSRLNASLGLLWEEESKAGLIVALGPGLNLESPGGGWQVEAGIGPALLSRHDFGEEDFGGVLQFISHAALRWRPCACCSLGYRVQHMSNAGLYRSNPGLNLHMLQFALHF